MYNITCLPHNTTSGQNVFVFCFVIFQNYRYKNEQSIQQLQSQLSPHKYIVLGLLEKFADTYINEIKKSCTLKDNVCIIKCKSIERKNMFDKKNHMI